MPLLSDITAFVKQAARDAGFELAGIAPVRDFPELQRFADWIGAGHAGEMKYMETRDEAGQLKRASLRSTIPWARSVIVCAINYNTSQPLSTQVSEPKRGWISRYAWGQEDYHQTVMKKLRGVEASLTAATNHSASGNPIPADQVQTRCYVDTGPLVERVYAKYAGV
ncbi:MAG TPA: QueG-associated DUF1730 domain-containing protein, partial [Terriglobales bacterium]|nr:QueG-associated DUF1730 domain-containing protein [Terriglobales bacterium]